MTEQVQRALRGPHVLEPAEAAAPCPDNGAPATAEEVGPAADADSVESLEIAFPDAAALLCDANTYVVRANKAAAELAGATVDELIGLELGALLIGADPDTRLCRPAGGEVPVRVVRLPAPGLGRQIVLLVDISDLASAAQDLREEERRLNDVQRVAGIASWEFDPATGETIWSANHYDILGLTPGTVTPGAQAVLDVAHPEDRDLVAAYWSDHKHSGDAIDIEYRVIRPDGNIRRIRGEAKSHCDARGELVRITGYIRDITEAWLVENELAKERVRLLEAQRIARMGSWTYEVAAGTIYRSEALIELFDEVGSVPDNDILSGVHPGDLKALADLRDRLLVAEHGETAETEFRGELGDKVYMLRVRAEHGEDRKVARLQATVQNVTEQRALERQLLRDRRRLDDAQRVSRLGTWEWYPGTGETSWSEMLFELYGVPPGQRTTYQDYLNLVHPEDRQWVDELWQQLAADEQPVECEHRLVRGDGAVRVFRCHGAAVLSPEGVTVMVGTAQDITEQRVVETRMQRSSQRFADLVSVTPVGIGIFDDSERLVDANDALCELLGFDLEQLRGMTAEQLTHPDEPAEQLSVGALMAAEDQKNLKIPQRVLLRSDNEPVYCELHVALSVQDDGRRFSLVVFQDITERRRTAEALKHQATHDDLTGLPNRAAVKELLAGLLHGDHPHGVAVLFCDIDNFKRVNDSLGHDAGDELLVVLARRLEGGLPKGCTAARLSGDEYVIICENIDEVGGVDALATKVSSLLRTVVPVHGQLVRISASIGAAVPNGSRATGDDLLRFADAAMFEAKRRGAGRVSLASAALMASADWQVHLEGQLRDALARDGLALHFQPVVDPSGTIVTAEALVRWPHPDRGLLSPDVFLPVAEQGDLLRELDRWVLRTALKEAANWPSANGAKAPGVAVNLAGLLPGDQDFVDIVATAVAEAGIEWDRVILELVETSLVDLPSKTRAVMAELVERGVRFAVDDFGTGYSSLARLKDLPAQIIKVDRRFVAGVGKDPSDFAVARAVVDMARAMGRSCVAEGVETATQFNILQGVGVDAYQGWLFSRAVPPREFRAVLSLGRLHVPKADSGV
ncbi:bifunctional diguanylate cyclase/phosphodiesterase [Crossiella cryophila]|uniref:Diguanylate cyclase (GGDEF)-like protein/PAS domain S-box-containing protein n=1 Tax=Crossiella cryophila TaxID=43355 RepID=A0A7W7C7G2_9PSEU|nr:EAL domain-containing protein [Crossiella cryophila]MBB4675885.1 diguanylate cyclase (GGDEF)-like protein/PAS domain S-box-containing protein [Crossiella cryophila]